MLSVLAVILIHSSPFDELPQKNADFTLKGGRTIVVTQIQFAGNTQVTTSELQELAEPYLQRSISESDLTNLEQEVKDHYVNKGYKKPMVSIVSKPKGGILTITIKESRK